MFGTAHLDLHQLMGSLRSVGEKHEGIFAQKALPAWPFITISRQAGAGGITLGQALVERLNAHDHSEHPWQFLDRELVKRIAADHKLSAGLVESLETSNHSWVSEFFGGLSHTDSGTPGELSIFRRVVETVRSLARAGHVILVGLGGVLITRDMPRGIHVRIIAPFDWRVKHLAQSDNLSEREARERVKLLDLERDAFFSRFWPGKPFNPELFHLTLNAGMMSAEQMSTCLAALVSDGVAAHA